MANTFINPAWVLMQTTIRLVNNLRFGNNIDRSYSDEYVQAGAKVGDTVKARLPQRFTRVKGAALVRQNLTDRTVDIKLTEQSQVGYDYQSWHGTLNVERYKERYMMPAVEELTNGFDKDCMDTSYVGIANHVGTPGVVPGSTGTLPQAATQTYLDASERLHNIGVPEQDRRLFVTPTAQNYLINGVITLQNPAQKLAQQYTSGQFAGEALGWAKWFMTQNVPTHTVGALGGTPLINGAVANGATSITIDGASNNVVGFLKRGDILQIAGVYDVNPGNRVALHYLKDFVVTADVDTNGSGQATVPISAGGAAGMNEIRGPGDQFQTVSALPADNAAITVFGHASSHAGKATRQMLGIRKEAVAGVIADLEKPGGCWVSERVSSAALAVSIRMVKQYQIDNDGNPARLDMVHGCSVIRPDLGVRISS